MPSIDNLYPGDPSSYYLSEILVTLQSPNQSESIYPGPPLYPGPPQVSVINNALWSLSLLLGVLCALMAISLQQWAQPPTGVTSSFNLLEQAQSRTRFAAKIESHDFAFLVWALHGLVHIASAIFLAGLPLYLYNVNYTVFLLAEVVTFLVLMVYLTLTLLGMTFFGMGRLQSEAPYSTPLSKVLAFVFGGISIFGWRVTYRGRSSSSRKFLTIKEQDLDDEVLGRTFDLLRSDDDLEQFFEALPGFFDSGIANSRRSLGLLGRRRLEEAGFELGRQTLEEALIGFWARTLTSVRVSESVKGQRLIICMRIIDSEAGLSITIPQILRLSVSLSGVSGLVEIARTLRSGRTTLLARVIIASTIWVIDEHDKHWGIISTNDEHDNRLDTLVMDELEISEDLFRRYLEHGKSLLLANLIHITRKFFHGLLRRDFNFTRKSLTILSSLSTFDITGTLPELQQEFCALWDKVDKQLRIIWLDNECFKDIRSLTQGLYGTLVALRDTHATPYPLSEMPDHRIQEDDGSITGEGNRSTADAATSPTLPPPPPPTSLTSSPPAITRSLSETGDALRTNEETIVSSMVIDSAAIRPDYIRQGQDSSSSASTTATSQLNMEEATVSRPSTIRRRTSSTIISASSNTHYPGPIRRTTSSAIIIEDDYAQGLGPTAHQQTRLTHHPGETDPSGADPNSLGRHDHDSSENSSKSA